MDMNMNAQVPISRITRDITMHVMVTGLTGWRIRMWIAMRLMVLVAWIAGMGIHVEMEHR
jgi:uncharacterized membrane protein (DUF441 family)